MTMYLVNDNYRITRPIILSFEELQKKENRDRFGCNFIIIGEFDTRAEAMEEFNNWFKA